MTRLEYLKSGGLTIDDLDIAQMATQQAGALSGACFSAILKNRQEISLVHRALRDVLLLTGASDVPECSSRPWDDRFGQRLFRLLSSGSLSGFSAIPKAKLLAFGLRNKAALSWLKAVAGLLRPDADVDPRNRVIGLSLAGVALFGVPSEVITLVGLLGVVGEAKKDHSTTTLLASLLEVKGVDGVVESLFGMPAEQLVSDCISVKEIFADHPSDPSTALLSALSNGSFANNRPNAAADVKDYCGAKSNSKSRNANHGNKRKSRARRSTDGRKTSK